jgi:hypothetical protein
MFCVRRKARWIDLAQLASLISCSFRRVTGFLDGEADERTPGLDRWRQSLLFWKWTAGDESADEMKLGCFKGDYRESLMGESAVCPPRPIGCSVTLSGELWEECRL